MSKLTTFNFHSMPVRVIEYGGEPWFMSKDVLDALEYPKGSRTYQLKQLGDDEKMVLKIKTNSRGTPNTSFISESGLYKLVMRSDKQEARTFQYWVTGAVLPAIRKDGAYVMGEEKIATGELSEDELVMKAMSIMQAKVERLKAERDGVVKTIGQTDQTISRFARTLPGVNCIKTKSDLKRLGYLTSSLGWW